MTDLMRDLIPILIMYGVVTLLAPFIAFALWLMYTGDRARDLAAAARRVPAEPLGVPVPVAAATAADDANARPAVAAPAGPMVVGVA